ncbi:MAG: hypothetical protein H7293_06450 [Candidatus Saccharibacteria bacterium]|nr:hypothetical protein [Rhodoferax sp.]
MNQDFNTTLKVASVLAAAFVANAGMTVLSAPGHTGTALAAGLLLTAFGLAFAKYSMEIVMLPIAVLSLLFRWALGAKAKPKSPVGSNRIDSFGRALFVVTYVVISGTYGLFVGAIDGGMGWFMSTVMFGVFGLFIAMLVPNDLVWGAAGGDANSSTPTQAGRADLEQARREGVPAVLFADQLAKSVAKAVTRGKTDTKS